MSVQVYDGSGHLQIPGVPGPQSFAHVGPTAPENPEVGQMWVPDDKYLIDQWDDDWQYPVLLNGWVEYSTATYGSVRYRKMPGGMVLLDGMVKNGTVGYAAANAVFNLPAGYRVTERHVVTGMSSGYVDTRLNIDPSNFVSVGAGATAWVSLHCAWHAEA